MVLMIIFYIYVVEVDNNFDHTNQKEKEVTMGEIRKQMEIF